MRGPQSPIVDTGRTPPAERRHPRRAALVAAVSASCAILVSGPFMGQLRGALQSALPEGSFRTVVGAMVTGAISVAVVAGLVRVKDRRALRYGSLALAVAGGAAYASATATGNPGVDLVERVHFIEYGLLTLVLFQVWRHRGDLATVASPVLAALLVAIADEWLQWFVPARVGEMRDVGLNAVAIGCGLLFALAVTPPSRLVAGSGAAAVAPLALAVTLLFGAFFSSIHLGHQIPLGSTTFRSRFTIAELDLLSAERTRRWAEAGPPTSLRRVSREDQYLAEGVWHVQRRNEAAHAGRLLIAWRENEILERFFAPVLDWASYASPAPSRWAAAQRRQIAEQVIDDMSPYASEAAPFPIYGWNRTLFWVGVMAAAALAGAVRFVPGRSITVRTPVGQAPR